MKMIFGKAMFLHQQCPASITPAGSVMFSMGTKAFMLTVIIVSGGWLTVTGALPVLKMDIMQLFFKYLL